MAKWKIEPRNVGLDRAAETMIVDAMNLVQAKQDAARGCLRHLSAGGDIYLEAKGRYTYGIILDMDEVGEATIACLEAGPRDVQKPESSRYESRNSVRTISRIRGGSQRHAETARRTYPDMRRKEMIR